MGIRDSLRFVWTHPLNADGRMKAVGRVVRWQVGSRLLAGPIALPFIDDTRLFVTRGMAGATGNWYCGLHEVAEMGFVLHALRPTDLFLDVGANVGSYTILAAGAVGARVVTAEPIPATFRRLSMNVELNGLSKTARCHQVGLSDRPGSLRFTDDRDTVNHVISETEEGGIEVPVTTIDALMDSDIPAIIKIDVEGYELPVVRGGYRTLAEERCLAVIVETNGSEARYGASASELLAAIRGHGFEPFAYDPVGRRLSREASAGENTIFVRDVAAVETRIRDAPRYRLVNGSI